MCTLFFNFIYKMKNFSIISLLLISILLHSQTNILYNDGTNTITTNIITKLNNGNYVFAKFNQYFMKLVIANENGDIQNQVNLAQPNTQINNANNNSIIVKDTNIYVLTNEIDYTDTTKYIIALTCYTYNFDTVWNKKYFVDTTAVFTYSFCNTNDNGFSIAGAIDKGGYKYDGLLIKVDSLGNLKWSNNYPYSSNSEEFTNIIQTQDNGYILSGRSQKYTLGFDDWYIVRTDSLGNQIWDWVLRNPDHDVPNIENFDDEPIADLIQTQDGNFVAVGAKCYVSDNYSYYNSRLLKFDINKNILLDTLYYEKMENSNPLYPIYTTHSRFIKIKQDVNGNYFIINKKQATPNNFNLEQSNLYILNSDFNLLKKIEFGSITWGFATEHLKDFVIENDGSLALIGDILSNYNYPLSTPTQRVWFIKTDENYCDGFGSCDTLQEIVFLPPDTVSKKDTMDLSLAVLSNTTDYFNSVLTYYHKDKYHIIGYDTLYFLNTNVIRHMPVSYKRLEEINEWPNIEIEDTVYIGCTITSTDSSSHAQYFSYISDNYIIFTEPDTTQNIAQIHKKIHLNVYPNPTDGQLNVEYINIENSSNINIYDMQGRTVMSFKAQPNFGMQSFDVSSLNSGNYLIGFGKNQTTKFIVK